LLLIATITKPALCQLKGSQEAYQIIAGTQARLLDRAAEAQAEFAAARKVSLAERAPMMNQPGAGKQLNPNQFEIGQVGRIDQFKTIVFTTKKEGAIVFIGSDLVTIYLENCPTKNLVDNEEIRIVDYVKVTDKRSIDGSKMAVLRMLTNEESKDIAKIDQRNAELHLQEIKNQEERQRLQELKEIRTWTAKNGKKFKAKFVKYASKTVEFETEDKAKIKLKISLLSEQDAEIVKEIAIAAK
jgi:hypothetical protein